MLKLWVRCHNNTKKGSLALAAALFLVIGASNAGAALPAPNWMPGFPIMAGNQMILMWSPVPGAAKYYIYINGKKVSESVAFQLTVPTPEKSGEYNITVSGVDASGAEGGQSSPGTIKIIALEPPPKVYTMVTGDMIGVRWDKSEGAMIYNVYKALKKGGEKKLIASTQDLIYRDKEVKKETPYYYYVTSKDVTGKESKFSPVVKAEIKVAAATAKAEKYDLVPIRTEYKVIKPAQNLISPSDMVFYKGNIYLVDNALRKVFIFNDNAELVSSFGEEGYLDGQLIAPRGIDVRDGVIALADTTREVILIYKEDGTFVREFEVPKKDKPSVPSYVAFTPKGNLMVVDGPNFRIVEMDTDGKVIGQFGERNSTPFFKLGKFGSASFINVDKDGRIFIVDKTYGKIHVIGPDYKPLFAIGIDKGVGSFVDGGKVAFDYEKGVVFVSDPMLATIQAFGLKDGKYKFSYFDSEKNIMNEYVPKWGIGSPRVLEIGSQDALWVIMGIDRALAKVTKVLDPLPQKKTK